MHVAPKHRVASIKQIKIISSLKLISSLVSILNFTIIRLSLSDLTPDLGDGKFLTGYYQLPVFINSSTVTLLH